MADDAQLSPPNPFTPLAFLAPDAAYQLTVAIYILVASLAILIWDFINNLKHDIRMLSRYSMTPSTVVYFISRFTCLAYLLAFTIILTAPVGHCASLPRVTALYVAAIPSTSLLLLVRVCSLYAWDTRVVALFSFLWFAVLGGSVTPILGISASNIGTTEYCISSSIRPFVSLSCIVSSVFDTLAFCAAGWRLMNFPTNVKSGVAKDVKVVGFGRYLPAISRAVFDDGQVHYLAIVILNLVTTSLFLSPSLPVIFRPFIGVPNIVLLNTKACHVYRQVRFGEYRDGASNSRSGKGHRTSLTSIVFARIPWSTSSSGATSRVFIELPELRRDSTITSDTAV